MADKTWENKTISSTDSIMGTAAAEKFTVSKVTVTSGGKLGMYSAGGVDTISATNVTITGGQTNLEGGDQNDKMTVSGFYQSDGYLQVSGGWDNDSITIQNYTMTGGEASINADTGKDTLSVAKISVTGGDFSTGVNGNTNTFNVNGVTVTGGKFTAKAGYIERIGDRNPEDVVESLGGYNTITATNISQSGGEVYIFDRGKTKNNIAVSNLTVTGGQTSIAGTSSEGVDTISVKNVSVSGSYSNNGKVYISAAGDGDSVSLENISVSAYYGKVYVDGGGANNTISVKNSAIAVSESYGEISIYGGTGGGNTSIQNVTIGGGDYYGGSLKAYSDGANTINADGVTVRSGYISLGSGGSAEITAQNISLKGGGVTLSGGTNAADKISLKNLSQEEQGGSVQIIGNGGKDSISAENVTLSGANASIIGGSDALNIAVDNVSMYTGYFLVSNSSLQSAGNDTISVSNVTVQGYSTSTTYLEVQAGDGADVVSLTSSAALSSGGLKVGGGNDSIKINNVTSIADSGIYFDGGSGTDSIYFGNSTVIGGDFVIYGGLGKDTITFENIYGTGYDFTRFTIYGDHRYTNSVASADVYSVKNVTMPSGSMYIYGTDSVNDTVSVDGLKFGGEYENGYGHQDTGRGYLYISMRGGNDSVSVSNIEMLYGQSRVEITGNAGADSISVDDVTMGAEKDDWYTNSRLSIAGGEGADNISVANVSVTGSYSKVYIEGNDGADKITVTDSNNVQITSGDGKDTLYLGGDVQGTISDYTATDDIISLSGGYNKAYYKDGVFIYGTGVKVSLGGVSDVSSIGSGVIYNGSTKTNFNDFVTVLEWKLESGVASYGDLITISGLSSVSAEEDLSLNKTTVTVSQNALDSSKTVEISDGYTLALGKDVESAVTTPEGWQILKGTAEYKTENVTAGYNVEDNKIVYTDGKIAETVVSVGGLKSSATEKQIKLDESYKKVSLAAAAVQGIVTISADYALEMGSGSYSKTSIQGGDGDDTIYSAGNKLAINGNDGEDFISLKSGTSGNSISGGAGDDTIISEKGKNIYQYAEGDGNDTWQGFTANDSIQITSGEITSWNVEDNDLTFNVGDGAITIKDGAGIKINTAIGKNKNTMQIYKAEGILNDKQTAITLGAEVKSYIVPTKPAIVSIDGSATNGVEISGGTKAEKIYGGAGVEITTLDSKNKATKQKYTSASAQTLDLLYDDNFVTDDFGIDDITAPKFEVQNIETQNNFELSQPVITYSEDK